jgi:hypothetical protein
VRQLGADDRRRPGQYLDAIRDVEKRLDDTAVRRGADFDPLGQELPGAPGRRPEARVPPRPAPPAGVGEEADVRPVPDHPPAARLPGDGVQGEHRPAHRATRVAGRGYRPGPVGAGRDRHPVKLAVTNNYVRNEGLVLRFAAAVEAVKQDGGRRPGSMR